MSTLTPFKERTLSTTQDGGASPRLPRLMIGMPIGTGTLPWPTALSLMNTVVACKEENVPCTLEVVAGCSVVTWARSAIVASFLKSDCTHLFWIDSDMVWTLDDFFRLVGFGAVLDVVGATYPLKKLSPMTFIVSHVGKPGEYEMNRLGCIKIRGMGLGFTIMKREVVEKVAAGKPIRRDPVTGAEVPDVFRIDHEGEDIAFMTDARAAGYDVWLDPSISLGHIGPMVFKGDVLAAFGLSHLAKEKK